MLERALSPVSSNQALLLTGWVKLKCISKFMGDLSKHSTTPLHAHKLGGGSSHQFFSTGAAIPANLVIQPRKNTGPKTQFPSQSVSLPTRPLTLHLTRRTEKPVDQDVGTADPTGARGPSLFQVLFGSRDQIRRSISPILRLEKYVQSPGFLVTEKLRRSRFFLS